MFVAAQGYHDPLITLSFRSIQQTRKKKEPRAQQKKMDQRFAKKFHAVYGKTGVIHGLERDLGLDPTSPRV
ncbi:MAG: hypothetical protein OEY80_09450 [Nitrospirota bacterium]|nr:hypothetical protein [Nitrospirota bacterium]